MEPNRGVGDLFDCDAHLRAHRPGSWISLGPPWTSQSLYTWVAADHCRSRSFLDFGFALGFPHQPGIDDGIWCGMSFHGFTDGIAEPLVPEFPEHCHGVCLCRHRNRHHVFFAFGGNAECGNQLASWIPKPGTDWIGSASFDVCPLPSQSR